LLLLKLAIPARGKIVFALDDSLLIHPKLPAKLVDLGLQRSDSILKLGELRLSLLTRRCCFLWIVRNNLLELEAVNDFMALKSIGC
jgi:hypothetical protein